MDHPQSGSRDLNIVEEVHLAHTLLVKQLILMATFCNKDLLVHALSVIDLQVLETKGQSAQEVNKLIEEVSVQLGLLHLLENGCQALEEIILLVLVEKDTVPGEISLQALEGNDLEALMDGEYLDHLLDNSMIGDEVEVLHLIGQEGVHLVMVHHLLVEALLEALGFLHQIGIDITDHTQIVVHLLDMALDPHHLIGKEDGHIHLCIQVRFLVEKRFNFYSLKADGTDLIHQIFMLKRSDGSDMIH